MIKDSTASWRRYTLRRCVFFGAEILGALLLILWTESILVVVVFWGLASWFERKCFPQKPMSWTLPGSRKQHLLIAAACCLASLILMLLCIHYPHAADEMIGWAKLIVLTGFVILGGVGLLNRLKSSRPDQPLL